MSPSSPQKTTRTQRSRLSLRPNTFGQSIMSSSVNSLFVPRTRALRRKKPIFGPLAEWLLQHILSDHEARIRREIARQNGIESSDALVFSRTCPLEACPRPWLDEDCALKLVDRDSDNYTPNYQPDDDDRYSPVVGQHTKAGHFVVWELMKMLWVVERFGGGIWYDDVEGGESFKEHFVRYHRAMAEQEKREPREYPNRLDRPINAFFLVLSDTKRWYLNPLWTFRGSMRCCMSYGWLSTSSWQIPYGTAGLSLTTHSRTNRNTRSPKESMHLCNTFTAFLDSRAIEVSGRPGQSPLRTSSSLNIS